VARAEPAAVLAAGLAGLLAERDAAQMGADADDDQPFRTLSAGVPEEVHAKADGRVVIPLQEGLRSLNIVNATAMILGEALRQTHGSGYGR
jgi:tRNA(Leu) C34 or U34 (ribose-2'-O)-methylase TrmL